MKLIDYVMSVIQTCMLVEMTNLVSKHTGINHVLHIMKQGGAKHGPRVKVSNVAGRWAEDDNFSLTLEPEPRVVGSCKIKKEHLDDIKDWIQLNREHLVKVWHDTGNMTQHDIKLGIQRL